MYGIYGSSDPRNQSSPARPEMSGDPVAPLAQSRMRLVRHGISNVEMTIDIEAPTTKQVLEGQVALKGSGMDEIRMRPETVAVPVATVVPVPDVAATTPTRDSDAARSPQGYQPQVLDQAATDSVADARRQLDDYFAMEGAQ